MRWISSEWFRFLLATFLSNFDEISGNWKTRYLTITADTFMTITLRQTFCLLSAKSWSDTNRLISFCFSAAVIMQNLSSFFARSQQKKLCCQRSESWCEMFATHCCNFFYLKWNSNISAIEGKNKRFALFLFLDKNLAKWLSLGFILKPKETP